MVVSPGDNTKFKLIVSRRPPNIALSPDLLSVLQDFKVWTPLLVESLKGPGSVPFVCDEPLYYKRVQTSDLMR